MYLVEIVHSNHRLAEITTCTYRFLPLGTVTITIPLATVTVTTLVGALRCLRCKSSH